MAGAARTGPFRGGRPDRKCPGSPPAAGAGPSPRRPLERWPGRTAGGAGRAPAAAASGAAPGFGHPRPGRDRRPGRVAGPGAGRRGRLHRPPPPLRGRYARPGIIVPQPPEPAPLSSSAHVIKTRLPDPPPPAELLLGSIHAAVEALKAKDVTEIDVRGRTSVCDYMVIASGTSTRHVK